MEVVDSELLVKLVNTMFTLSRVKSLDKLASLV